MMFPNIKKYIYIIHTRET